MMSKAILEKVTGPPGHAGPNEKTIGRAIDLPDLAAVWRMDGVGLASMRESWFEKYCSWTTSRADWSVAVSMRLAL